MYLYFAYTSILKIINVRREKIMKKRPRLVSNQTFSGSLIMKLIFQMSVNAIEITVCVLAKLNSSTPHADEHCRSQLCSAPVSMRPVENGLIIKY